MKIETREEFDVGLEIFKENIITAIKMQINKLFINSDKALVREICFAECMTANPIYRQSEDDFSTLCIDDVKLTENEKLIFTYSSELQDLKEGVEEDLTIENALDILTTLEDLTIDLED